MRLLAGDASVSPGLMASGAYMSGLYRALYICILLKSGFYISLVFRFVSPISMDAAWQISRDFLALVARGLTFLGPTGPWQSETGGRLPPPGHSQSFCEGGSLPVLELWHEGQASGLIHI